MESKHTITKGTDEVIINSMNQNIQTYNLTKGVELGAKYLNIILGNKETILQTNFSLNNIFSKRRRMIQTRTSNSFEFYISNHKTFVLEHITNFVFELNIKIVNYYSKKNKGSYISKIIRDNYDIIEKMDKELTKWNESVNSTKSNIDIYNKLHLLPKIEDMDTIKIIELNVLYHITRIILHWPSINIHRFYTKLPEDFLKKIYCSAESLLYLIKILFDDTETSRNLYILQISVLAPYVVYMTFLNILANIDNQNKVKMFSKNSSLEYDLGRKMIYIEELISQRKKIWEGSSKILEMILDSQRYFK